MNTPKEYTIFFEGKMTVEAESEAEATEQVYDTLSGDLIQFGIKAVKEGPCALCGGTGIEPEDVNDGEGHTERGTGSRMCDCKRKEESNEE